MKKLKYLAAGLLLALVLLIALSAWQGSHTLTVTQYTLSAPVASPLRIVQLTDLHGHSFGEGNETLIDRVAALKPTLILMTGDMLDKSDPSPESLCALIEALSELTPVYFGYGNHEYDWMSTHNQSLTPALTQAGATVLDIGYVDVEVEGTPLRIGGYHGYYRQPHMFPVSQEQKAREIAFCDDFEDTDRCKLLLSHIPTPWLDWGYIDDYPVELVLCGHYHGGQLRLPLLGGVYAPYVGLFPRYTQGVFTGEKATCVLSRGLGSTPGIPRINNPPEILVIDLTPENTPNP